MFSTNKSVYVGNEKCLIESVCLSTDTKPTDGIANGSKCTEMDTGDIYMFDEAGGEWIKLGSGGGGDAEVWLAGDTGESGMFTLSNVGDINHMEELFVNGENYQVFANSQALPYYTPSTMGGGAVWKDNATEQTSTTLLSIEQLENDGYSAVLFYVDASTAPDSVEVSVKAK